MSEETHKKTYEINADCLEESVKLARDLSHKYLVEPYFNKETMVMAPLLGAVAHDAYKECIARQR